MKVISDASILIHLARVRCFNLLKSLYEELVIATGVYLEVVEIGWGFPGSFETEKAIKLKWMEVKGVANKARSIDLMRGNRISRGNAETIQLAIESGTELVLADEVEVRSLLEEYGIRARGCIGLLIEAAKKDIITTIEAKQVIGRLVETGYRVSDNILNLAYRLLGEQ